MITDAEVDQYLVRISSGKLITQINKEFIIFKYPTNDVKLYADAIYTMAYQEALDEGLLNDIDLEKLIRDRNIFTAEDEKKLSKLESQLDAQKILLGKTTRVRANQDRIKKIIQKIKEEMFVISSKKSSRMMMSAEVRANEERTLYLCWDSTYDHRYNKYWSKLKYFKETTNISFREEVLNTFLRFYYGIPTNIIRYIARHSLWRIRYVNSQKVSEKLFGKPSSDYTTDMLSLAYWSNYYDSIYQMMPEDRPSDLVIEDDDSLDAYMKSFYEERTREDASRRSKHKTPGKLSAFDQEEVIITASNSLYRDITYDTPREAKKLKDRADVKKRTKRG